ncbi:MAG: hypothetical protein RBU30_17095 [Polyangia bacterium]|nr:hypothetical protein [Polyangia bacterium]
MATQKSPLSGYNHNLKYKGRVYHVQTEDSGLDNPHIFTHLFHDGTILSTAKQEYKDLLSDPDWESKLRTRMQSQHKDMMKELVKGGCDERIVAFFGMLEALVEEEIPMATLPPPPKRERAASGEAPAPRAPTRAETPSMTATPATTAMPQPQAQPPHPAMRAPSPSATPWNPQPMQAAPHPRHAPPVSSGGVVVAMPMVIVGGQNPQQARAPSPSASMATPTAAPQIAYRPEESKTVPDSIFGSDLITEKSLDEVILAYLSEDLAEK